MGFGKSSPFLALSILVLCQAGGLQATPLRWALESLPDSDLAALNEKEGHLLASLVKAYAQRNTNELDQPEEQETEAEDSSLDSSITKPCSNLSICVLGAYLKYLKNFHMFSGIGFGAETLGKKRDIASGLEKDRYPSFGVPKDSK
ncbi:Calcitonin [Myotis brandtii]|uniref:Calcitonin n=1 Tax=Myotis brandtii TaxID=109478 RepID=S7Q4Q9_MYOBR|nr:Calcitonin [Myotis brandtii]